jgi:farnesyl diphosphate synthase
MTFEQRLQAARETVEADLARRLARPDRTPARLRAAMTHAVLGGGKRFRPFLVLETAALLGADQRAAVTVAAALEAIHCYSLAHDDLPAMDNDETRRGQPTVWKAYDEWTAILAGDALLTVAFAWLAEPGSGIAPAAVGRLVAELAEASGPIGMVGGQVIDLDADKRGEPQAPTLAHVKTLQEMKTGALIRFACRAGPLLASPLLAGREDADLNALTVYGDALGFAFQISDDLLDATGTVEEVGKAVAKDAAAGKATLLSLYGLDGARQVLAETQSRAIAALAPYGPRADALRAAVDFMAARKS